MSSSRMKRLLKELKDIRGGSDTKRKRHLSVSDDEDVKATTQFLSEYVPPVTNIYNSGTGKKPAELFRKDLISAMKLPDSEQLDPKEYIVITDHWKPEWERGVQVPVNPDSLPRSGVRILENRTGKKDFRMPKKYIRSTHNEFYSNEIHTLVNDAAKAEKVCRYDLDLLDDQWLKRLNEERQILSLPLVEEDTVEVAIEEFEIESYSKIQETIQNEQGLGIEFDEDVICDVCRSPDSEEGNEMVFCDSCDICVHQACYGITQIPEGSWICKTCTLGSNPECILCPNKGGAMKPVKNGSKWTHVSCALWIPEVSIGCVEKMEPITKINQIPSSRWNLVCSQCKERNGACIQCSVKTCKTAYHVTCAFKDCLEMKAILMENENGADGVKLRSYCKKHSQKKEKKCAATSDSDSDGEESSKTERKKFSMSEDKTNARNARLQELETEFYKYVNVDKVADSLQIDKEVTDFIYQYWKLKRLANFTRPLLRPKEVERDLLNKQQEDSLYEKMKMFVHLRQDLERVRNLCYMVSRREKLSRSLLKARADVFTKQAEVMHDESLMLTERERQTVIHANHTDNIYDVLYSSLPDNSKYRNVASILSVLSHPTRTVKIKKPKVVEPNPYAKQYVINRLIHRTNRRSGSCDQSAEGDALSVSLPISEIKLECDTKDLNLPVLGKNVPVLKKRPENEENTRQNECKKESVIKTGEKAIISTFMKSPKNRKNRFRSRSAITENDIICSSKLENNLKSFVKSEISPSKKFGLLKCSEYSSNREKLREVNAKIRESMFSNTLSSKSSVLSGYKIPKKVNNVTTKEVKKPRQNLMNSVDLQNSEKSLDAVKEETLSRGDLGAPSSPERLLIKLHKDSDFLPKSSSCKRDSEISSSNESSQHTNIPEQCDKIAENTRLTRRSLIKNGICAVADTSNCYPIRSRQADPSKGTNQLLALPL